MTDTKNLKYDEALEQLQDIVGMLERKEIKIDELSDRVKEAKKLVDFCRDKLRVTEDEISKIINPDDLAGIINGIDWAEYIITGDLDTQLKEARRNLGVYLELIEEYNEDLITADDLANDDLEVKPGSIPYLAMTSHGLSHTDLFDDSKHKVKDALMSAFSSGSNPGYNG